MSVRFAFAYLSAFASILLASLPAVYLLLSLDRLVSHSGLRVGNDVILFGYGVLVMSLLAAIACCFLTNKEGAGLLSLKSVFWPAMSVLVIWTVLHVCGRIYPHGEFVPVGETRVLSGPDEKMQLTTAKNTRLLRQAERCSKLHLIFGDRRCD